MKSHIPCFSLLCLASALVLPVLAQAGSVTLATSPLATSSPSPILPNVILMMDDSGSMANEYLPDDANSFQNKYGYKSSQCNGVYYDPTIAYVPPVYSTGTKFPDASFTAAWNDGYNTNSGTPKDLTGSIYYTYIGGQVTNAQKNYFDTNSTFYKECNSSIGSSPGLSVFTQMSVGVNEQTNFANWYSYYRTRINMMKTATGLAFVRIGADYRVGFATMNNNGGTDFINPSVFDTTQKLAWYNKLYATKANKTTPLLGALADIGKIYANKLAKKHTVTVVDPIQYSCQQNFTILTTDGYWNDTAGDTTVDTTPIPVGNQDGSAARPMYDGATLGNSWTNTYTRTSYTTSSSNSCTSPKTKLVTTVETTSCTVNAAGGVCSPNWNSQATTKTKTTASTCASNTASTGPVVLQSSVQNTSGGTSDTLADVAMYYYQTDLRTSSLNNCTGVLGTNVCENNVFKSTLDNNPQQHMTTFTLGLGAKGRMVYSSSYLSDTTGDFVSVKLGSTASSTVCTWQSADTVCNWPIPDVNGTPENIDDLWHAAVNGRGAYFNATNSSSLSASLANALAGINARKGAAAAAATSTLNPVAGNNFAYVASYTTVKWQGNLEARGINVDTGVTSENATWCAENVTAGSCAAPGTIIASTSGSVTISECVTPGVTTCTNGTLVPANTLDANGATIPAGCHVPIATACTGTMGGMVGNTSDTRTIYTANSTGTALTMFDSAYATANPTNFSAAHINMLNQWGSLTPSQKTAAAGVNLINYLRGQQGYEDRAANVLDNRLYRTREAVLGDALESQPSYIGAPTFSYPYPGYSNFLTAQGSRAGTVYIGANDGMLHAFAADTGIERWAYVPSAVIPNMWKLADKNYSTMHTNFVNGSPVTSDICTVNCNNTNFASTTTTSDDPVWKTILVGGLNGGGRGFYALDITNPASPSLLWEFTPSTDSDVGYSYGAPVVTRKTDGTWVVLLTSGYDNGTDSATPVIPAPTPPTFVPNSPAGSGIGYVYVLNANTGAIISKISTSVGTAATPSGLAKIAAWNNEPAGNLTGYVYGGDLLGNVWRFDINSTATATIGTGSALQFAILKDPAGNTQPVTTTPVLGKVSGSRVIFVGTGKYLETADLSTTQVQTQYAIEDNEATTTLVNPRATLVNQTITNAGATRNVSNSVVNFYTGRGWYVDFPDSGERVNIDSKLIQGTLLVPTIVPSNTVCSPGGYGWLNYFNFATGGSVIATTTTNGVAAPGVASAKYDSTIVGVNVVYINDQPKVEVVTSTNPTPEITNNVSFASSTPSFAGKRVLWRELIP